MVAILGGSIDALGRGDFQDGEYVVGEKGRGRFGYGRMSCTKLVLPEEDSGVGNLRRGGRKSCTTGCNVEGRDSARVGVEEESYNNGYGSDNSRKKKKQLHFERVMMRGNHNVCRVETCMQVLVTDELLRLRDCWMEEKPKASCQTQTNKII